MRTLEQIVEVLKELDYDIDSCNDARVRDGMKQSAQLSTAGSYIISAESCIKAQLEEDAIYNNKDITRWVNLDGRSSEWVAVGWYISMHISLADKSDKHRGNYHAGYARNDGVHDQAEMSKNAWPRYYLDLEYAMRECERWMRQKGEWKG